MKNREQTIYDIHSEKFKHLKKVESIGLQRVDINELNKRLNVAKRSSFFYTILTVIMSLSSLIILTLISIKF